MPSYPLALVADASSLAVGAVLQQKVNDEWQPLAFFSRCLTSAQTRYSVFGQELLAIFLAVRHFRHLLEGRPFAIFADHKPLTYSFGRSESLYTPREVRQLAFISVFSTDIRHISGADNAPADALSHVDAITRSRSKSPTSVSFPFNLQELANDQAKDSELRHLREASTSLQLEPITFEDVPIVCDTSTGSPRPFLTGSFRKLIFEAYHSLLHPGI